MGPIWMRPGDEDVFLATVDDLAECVRSQRAILRATQKQIADKAGVSRAFVADLEVGHPRAQKSASSSGSLMPLIFTPSPSPPNLWSVPTASHHLNHQGMTGCASLPFGF